MHQARRLLLGLLLAGASFGIAAQEPSPVTEPRTGDAWIDKTLDDIDRYGARYPDAFVDELVRYHAAPRDYVTDLLASQQWTPGDVYYACAIAGVIGRSCRYVAEAWKRDPAQGWGALAERLGIAPDSAGFQQLKQGFAPSYERWARPLPDGNG